jgi:hypothetical protein
MSFSLIAWRLLNSVFVTELLRDLPESSCQTFLHLFQDKRDNRTIEGFSNASRDAGKGVTVTPPEKQRCVLHLHRSLSLKKQ